VDPSSSTPELTRRTLLRAAAAGGALVATGGLPAWARPVQATSSLRRPDSLPFPHLPAGTPSMPQIGHIVVLMMENHSFDDLLGMVPYQVPGRTSVDGWTLRKGKLRNSNPDASGKRVYANHSTSPCQLAGGAIPGLEQQP
jgi:phospholipase C